MLHAAADAWADRAGGTSGALWGVALRGSAHGSATRSGRRPSPSPTASPPAATAITAFGKAEVGDKTMVDVLVPFDDALSAGVAAGPSLSQALGQRRRRRRRGRASTADLLPRMGRARPHAEKSLGTPDAGAISLSLIVRAIADELRTSTTTSTRE